MHSISHSIVWHAYRAVRIQETKLGIRIQLAHVSDCIMVERRVQNPVFTITFRSELQQLFSHVRVENDACLELNIDNHIGSGNQFKYFTHSRNSDSGEFRTAAGEIQRPELCKRHVLDPAAAARCPIHLFIMADYELAVAAHLHIKLYAVSTELVRLQECRQRVLGAVTACAAVGPYLRTCFVRDI